MSIAVDARPNERQLVLAIEETDLALIIHVRIATPQLGNRCSLECTELRHLLHFERPLLGLPDFVQ